MSFLKDLWASFLSLSLWVRVWILLILIPINFATLAFIGNPSATLIATLAISGIAFNLIPMIKDRGFTDAMAVPHVIFWIPLILVIVILLISSGSELSEDYRYFLFKLMACNVFSLVFDIPDAIKWFKRGHSSS